MNAADLQILESNLRSAGRALPYPPTPPIASAVMTHLNVRKPRSHFSNRWTWALVTLLVVLSALLLVPPARAAILDFIQIGVVRIFRGPGVPPAPAPTASLATPALQAPLTATPALQAPPATATLPPLADLAGETTLTDAQARLEFPLLLPTYPADLGKPDRVYLQDLGGPSMLVLVWLDTDQSGHVRMSLDEITAGSWIIEKFNPPVVEEAQVNGQRAIWTEGPYLLQAKDNNYVEKRLVEGHVLVWTQGKVTYRLETSLSLAEAIKIAESLKPLQASDVPIPADLEHAQALVQRLREAGVAVLSVQHSMEGSLFESSTQAAWIKTDIGIADAVIFLDPAESEHIQITSLQSQGTGRYLYRIQAPPPTMLEARTIDAAFPLYFEVGKGMFIQTNSAELDTVLRRLLLEMSNASSRTP